MTEVEMVELCAEAMGYEYVVVSNNTPQHTIRRRFKVGVNESYYPLTDDADAMALVKRFMLVVDAFSGIAMFPFDDATNYKTFSDESINYAIVECVAKMQKDRHPK